MLHECAIMSLVGPEASLHARPRPQRGPEAGGGEAGGRREEEAGQAPSSAVTIGSGYGSWISRGLAASTSAAAWKIAVSPPEETSHIKWSPSAFS